MSTQVVVVGAGPVGLTLAAELARYGVSVRIFETAAQRTDKSKALVLWSRSLELLARAGCAERFVAAGHKVTAANIIAGQKVIGHISLAGADSPYPYALMLPQSDTERLLEEHLNTLGVLVERQVTLTGFEAGAASVACHLRGTDGDADLIHSDWLVGCDGAHSTVRHALALPFDGNTLHSDWMLADVHLAGYPLPASEIATYWHEQGVLVVFPITEDRFRVIADLGLSKGEQPPAPTLEQVQEILDARGPGAMTASKPVWLSAFRINERKVTSYRVGRVFVAGDAAHVHSPAGGQGMNTGMQDAFNLAWKLALVVTQRCDESLLQSYSDERSAVGEQVLLAAGRLTSVAVMKSHAAQSVRNFLGRVLLGVAPIRDAMVNTMMEVSIGYSTSPLNGANVHRVAGPAAGQRVRPADTRAPIGSGRVALFVLFAKDSAAARLLIANHSDLVNPIVEPPLNSEGIWLVRPDGYVGCVAHADDFKTIEQYLERLRLPLTPVG